MKPDYSTRRATSGDAAFIVEARRRMFADMGRVEYAQAEHINARYTAWITPRLGEGRYIGWIIDAAGQPVAHAGLELLDYMPVPASRDNLRGHIVNVYVYEAHRRQGLARHLMLTLLDWCAQEQIGLITLNASEAGRPLYESLGFEASNEMVYQGRIRS